MVKTIEITNSWRICSFLILKDRPVILAHKKMVMDAMPNLMPAVVKTPIPSRLILMATALAPKSMHINTVKTAAKKERSLF
jgi:hypothetical protein